MTYEEVKKQFIKNIEKLSVKVSPFQVFDDLMEFYSIVYTNPFCPFHDKKWQERENRYNKILNQYNKELLEDCFACIVNAFELKECDFLGDVFMSLMINDKKGKGQVFTPYHVGELMAKECFTKEHIEQILKEKDFISVYDPAVGGGCLLLASFYQIKQAGYNPQEIAFFYGADLDIRCCRMAFIQLSVIGAKARVDNMNSLTLEHYGSFYTPAFLLGGLSYLNMENIDNEIVEAFEPFKDSSVEHLKKEYKDNPVGFEQGKKRQIFNTQLELF